jgi:hypothetical protein
VANLNKLLAEQGRLALAQKQIAKDIAAAEKKNKAALRRQVVQLLSEHGTTVEELFGAKSSPTEKKRSPGIPKYFLDGQTYDGRAARAVTGFDGVRVHGKIDDKKALKAGMINPEWLASSRPDVKAFAKRFGL